MFGADISFSEAKVFDDEKTVDEQAIIIVLIKEKSKICEKKKSKYTDKNEKNMTD